MTVIITTYNKKYIFGLNSGVWQDPKTLGILEEKTHKSAFCYVNEATWAHVFCYVNEIVLTKEPNLYLEYWNFLSHPWPLGVERGWRLHQSPMANNLISNAYVMKPPEAPEGLGFTELWVGEHMEI